MCRSESTGYFPHKDVLEAEECEEFSRKPLMVPGSTWGGVVDRHSTWKGYAKTLEVSAQRGKDLQRPWKDHLNLERIHNDSGRILFEPSPPQDQHCQRDPSKDIADPFLSKFRQFFQSHCRSFSS